MCGIFAYNGKKDSREKLVNGLQMLEYRGYDSAGIVAIDEKNNVFKQKAVGRVSALANKINLKDDLVFSTGIAHTRWATHGEVNEANTHPHVSQNERFYVVHNGIIENYKELKNCLKDKYSFYSETDSEVIAKLLEESYNGDLKQTVETISKMLVGAYSLAIIDKQEPGKIIGLKLGSPLIVGTGNDGIYISSDVNALGEVANKYSILEDNEMVVIEGAKYHIYMSGEEIDRETEEIDGSVNIQHHSGFDSFTEKEIFEIPSILENVWNGRIDFNCKEIKNETLDAVSDLDIDGVVMISSGSSYYASEVGGYFFRKYSGINSISIISSEFLSDVFIPDHKKLYVFLSQSGETADVRESMKIVKSKGCKTFGIVNVVGSTIARMSDYGLYSHAGVEIGVASTKNVLAQIATLLIMSLSIGLKRDTQVSEIREIISDLNNLPENINEVLKQKEYIKSIAKKYSKYDHMFMLGRNFFYPVAGEASLKCKELSYIHSESYSAGELKHGPLALVSPQFPAIVFNPMGKFYSKTISNIQEVIARKGPILGFISESDTHKELYTDKIEIPNTSELISIFTSLVGCYLFSIYIAEDLGRDIDKPRNLAKSVTVE